MSGSCSKDRDNENTMDQGRLFEFNENFKVNAMIMMSMKNDLIFKESEVNNDKKISQNEKLQGVT